jgi:hypothetical protein
MKKNENKKSPATVPLKGNGIFSMGIQWTPLLEVVSAAH